MRPSTKFSKRLFAASMLAGSLLAMSGCGPDYAIFKVTITSVTTPRNNIEECRMSITNENGVKVMDDYPLPKVYGKDSSGNTVLQQGCGDGQTNGNIGTLSYSRSSTSGTLTFTVDAWDNTGQQCGYTKVAPCLPVQTSQTSDTNFGPTVAPKAYPPEVQVGVAIAANPPYTKSP